MRRGISFSFVLLLSSLLLQILPACTGCGGGGSLIVEITSHNDGDSVTGSKTVTISGTIRNAESVASVTVDHNGTESDATFDNRSFSAEVTLDVCRQIHSDTDTSFLSDRSIILYRIRNHFTMS